MVADDIKSRPSTIKKLENNEESPLSDTFENKVEDEEEQLTVCIFGFSFKKNTGDARMSQAAYIIHYLSTIEGINVHIHDP